VSFPGDEIDELTSCFAGLSTASEGGTAFILIPAMNLPAGCDPKTADALLCPTPRDGYPSRLFFSAKISHQGPGQNWNAAGVVILSRQWWAVSWKAQDSNKRLSAILASHLEAFRSCKK